MPMHLPSSDASQQNVQVLTVSINPFPCIIPGGNVYRSHKREEAGNLYVIA